MVKKERAALVKINRELHDVVKAIVEQNSIEFPSIKHFIEKAIMSAAGFRRYNIGGIDDTYIEEKPLKKLVGESTKNFVICIVCNRAFLKNKEDNSENARICPNCKSIILHFANKLKKNKEIKKEGEDGTV